MELQKVCMNHSVTLTRHQVTLDPANRKIQNNGKGN
jgi:hypothetical protein